MKKPSGPCGILDPDLTSTRKVLRVSHLDYGRRLWEIEKLIFLNAVKDRGIVQDEETLDHWMSAFQVVYYRQESFTVCLLKEGPSLWIGVTKRASKDEYDYNQGAYKSLYRACMALLDNFPLS